MLYQLKFSGFLDSVNQWPKSKYTGRCLAGSAPRHTTWHDCSTNEAAMQQTQQSMYLWQCAWGVHWRMLQH